MIDSMNNVGLGHGFCRGIACYDSPKGPKIEKHIISLKNSGVVPAYHPDPPTLAFLKKTRKARETPQKTRVILFAEPL